MFQRADGSPRRVLYAEDQITSRVVTKAMLERMGFDVDAVEDGELALQCARNDNYDVILLDIEMPVMDGVTAARSIRAELSHCADTPILALSAFLADSTEHSAWRDAFDSAVPKPANGNELLKAMTKAVAFKTARAKLLPAKPASADLLDALRGNLSPALWARLGALAVDEMNHLVNTIGAGEEAKDEALLQHARMNLKGLAVSFGATEVASLVLKANAAALRKAVGTFRA
jgi:CheY-like chemotaxis protein